MMFRHWITYITVAAALLVATTACGQWTFTLDQDFRTQILEKNVNSIAFMADGGLLLSGRMRFLGDMNDRSSVRLLPNGQRDLSFPTFPQTTGSGKITPWLGGKYYVGTTTVRRLLADGYIDPSFIAPHTSPYFQGGSGGGGDYHVYPDGRILLSGRHLLSDSIRGFEGYYNLFWLSSEGYIDTTRIHRQGNGTVGRFQELPNGQFICSGTCTEFEGKAVDWIFRVNADGSPDTTFRTGVYIGAAYSFLPMADGLVYAGGNFLRSEAPEDTLRLVRFLPDGGLDPTFSIPHFNDGVLDWPFGATITNLQPWNSGSILVTGQFRYVNGQSRNGICLIDSTGQLLDAFSGQGVGIYDTPYLDYATVEHTIFDSVNSYLYICGAYVGYGDGMTTDPQQRFVSRLLVSELSVGAEESSRLPAALQLHPNPANTWVAMDYTVEQTVEALYVVLRDLAGGELARVPLAGTQGREVLQTQNLPAGVYTVELLQGGRVKQVQRLVVQP